MKKKKKKIKYYLKKCATGTISLFLIVLLTPFLTIASILLETQHYNSAVALLDEAMGVSSVSLLADYDKYLKDRWGLIATKQQTDMNEVFSDYLKTNTSVLGSTLNINNTQVNGLYPLSDDELFKNQIVQYSKYNVTTKVVEDTVEGVLDIVGITEKLKSLSSIDNILKLVTNCEKTADSMVTLSESQDKFKEASEKVRKQIEECNKKFNQGDGSFESRMNKLTEEMKNEDADEKDINKRKTEYTEARNDYIAEIDKLISELENYKKEASALSSAMTSVKNNLVATTESVITVSDDTIKTLETSYKDAKKAVEDYTGDVNSDEYKNLVKARDDAEKTLIDTKMEKSVSDAVYKGDKAMDTSYSAFQNKCSEAYIEEQIQKLKDLKDEIPTEDEITEDSTAGEYSIGSIEYATVDEIKEFIKKQEDDMNNSGFISFIKGLVTTMDSLVKSSGLYESALCAVVNGDMPDSPAKRVIDSISTALKGIIEFNKADSLKAYWEAIKKICGGIKDAIVNINDFSAQMIAGLPVNVYDLFTTDRLWYTAYCYYMLTCRTDYSSSTFQTGKPAMKALEINPDLPVTDWQNNIYGIGEITSFIQTFAKIASLGSSDNGNKGNTTFYGAEMEYLICGTQAEMANQVCVFMMTYMMRLIIDAPAVVLNKEVQAMAEAAGAPTFGVGTAVVYALEILLEPFVDTIILVNGGKIPLYETTIYLSPSGILDFITNVAPSLSFTEEQKKSIKDGVGSAFGDPPTPAEAPVDSGKKPDASNKGFKASSLIPKIDYRQQCLLLMILFVKNDDMIDRLQSVIQMETKYHYEKNSADFSLDKSYTFVEVEADAKIKQIAPSLTDSSIFEVKRKIYRGY